MPGKAGAFCVFRINADSVSSTLRGIMNPKANAYIAHYILPPPPPHIRLHVFISIVLLTAHPCWHRVIQYYPAYQHLPNPLFLNHYLVGSCHPSGETPISSFLFSNSKSHILAAGSLEDPLIINSGIRNMSKRSFRPA